MSKKQTLHFIRLVKERDVLWNRTNPSYRDMHKQKRAWMEISNIVNIPTSSLIQKWKSLSGSYRMYNARVLQTAGTPEPFTPIWFAYDAMCFLEQIKQNLYVKRNTVQRKVLPQSTAPLPTTTKCEEDAVPATVQQRSAKSHETPTQQEPPDTPTRPQPSTSEAVYRKGRTRLLADLMANEAETLELLRNIASPVVPPSDVAQFGLTVSGLVQHFSPGKRERLYKKILETICNHDAYDEDVVSYGTTIMHLLQNMIKNKRRSTYCSIVQLIAKCEATD